MAYSMTLLATIQHLTSDVLKLCMECNMALGLGNVILHWLHLKWYTHTNILDGIFECNIPFLIRNDIH